MIKIKEYNMSTKENRVNDRARTLGTFIKDACASTKEDIIEARKSGDKFAKEFVAPIKIVEPLDKMIEKGASVMGQMTAGGVTLLMCPMKIVSAELSVK